VEKGRNSSIVMIIGLFHPFVGGAEKVCQRLSKGLRKEGLLVIVLTQHADGLPDYEVIDGIPVYRKIRGWHPFGLFYMFSVFCFLVKNRRRYDIIQCFGLWLFNTPVFLMKYLFGKRIVLRPLCSGQYGDFVGIEHLKLRRLILATSKLFDRIIYLSHAIKKELVENRFPLEKLTYIPNSVDINRFRPPGKSERCQSKKVCYVGRIEEQKGLEYLIEAMAVVTSQEDSARLFIVGEGKRKPALEELCKRLKLEEHVVFTGFAQDILHYYQDARIFVLPSLSEGMSSSLLEAMSCGLPVIATMVGGNTDIVDPGFEDGKTIESHYHIGEHGILVKQKDAAGIGEALLKLLRDDELAFRLGERAKNLVEKRFSHERIVRDYMNLYASLD